jgi:hypothetical protein
LLGPVPPTYNVLPSENSIEGLFTVSTATDGLILITISRKMIPITRVLLNRLP